MSCKALFAGLALTFAPHAAGQGVITTSAGADWLFPAGSLPALQAPIGGSPLTGIYVAAEPGGAFYIVDPDNLMVFRVAGDGTLRIVAGNGIAAHSGDGGPATAAAIGPPTGIALDRQGGVYIAFAERIRRVDARGIISTIAGTGTAGFSGDGLPALSAQFNGISGIALDSNGRLLVADRGNRRIRAIAPGGSVSTLASGLAGPAGVAVDLNGNVYFPDVAADGSGQLKALDSVGRVSTTLANVATPAGVAVDGGGNIFLADIRLQTVVRYNPAFGVTTPVAGSGAAGLSGDGGPALSARLYLTAGSLALDNQGNLLIADNGNGRVRRVGGNGSIATVAGNGGFRSSGDGSPAAAATLFQPAGIAFDAAGNLYVAEPARHRVRRIAANGIVTTFAGTGQSGATGDNGFATAATLAGPSAVAVDNRGTVYIADTLNSRIRAVSDGRIRTFWSQNLNQPRGLAVDAAGNLYIADTENNRITRIATDGSASPVAGAGQRGFAGENNAAAVQALLNQPVGIAVDAAGQTVWFADSGNGRVRRVRNGAITTVAEGLNRPTGLALGPDGALYVSEEGGNRVRRIDASGGVRVAAGTGTAGYTGDGGPADRATLAAPSGLALDAAGALSIADQLNHRIRKILTVAPTLGSSPATLDFFTVPGDDPTGAKVFFVTSSVPGVPFTATADRGWLEISPASGITPAAVEVRVDPKKIGDDASDGTISISSTVTNPARRTVVVRLRLGTRTDRGIQIESLPLDYSLFENDPASSQPVTLFNTSDEEVEFQAAAITKLGWLSVSPTSGRIPPRGRIALNATVDMSGRTSGTYTGSLRFTEPGDGEVSTLPVNVTLSAVPQSILLTHTGLTFTSVAQGAASPPQTVGVFNVGRGTLQWTASGSGLSGTARWLSVTPDRGSSAGGASNPAEFTVSVDHSGLEPGDYYGQVLVSAPGADNSPQVLLVVLTVLPAGSTPTPVPLVTTLVFHTAAGAGSPGSQSVTFANLTNRLFTYTSGRLTQSGAAWFSHVPATGAIGGSQTTRIVVQPVADGLAPGVYRGSFTLQFDNGTPRSVNVVLIVSAPGTSTPRKGGVREAGECVPTSLTPVFTSLAPEVAIPAGWPQRLIVRVLDNCGEAMTNGSVTARFSNNTPPLTLTSLKDGNWAGTWQSRDNATSVTISVKAEQPERQLRGTAEITGTIRANDNPPRLGSVPIVSAATFAADGPLAPGMLVTITGSRLARNAAAADGFPLPSQLAGTLVAIGGRTLPLVEVAEDSISAIVPFDVPVNARHQVIVQRDGAATAPETVTVAQVQPGVFTREKTGVGQGLIFKVGADGSLVPADSDNPARAGDTILVRCTGLGTVDPAVPSGSAAPADPPARTALEVNVTIGGVPATVESAFLEPGAAGVYAIRAIVPEGVAPGDEVQVVVGASVRSSPVVTMAVR